MGKCKKRTISKIRNDNFKIDFTRREAVKAVTQEIDKNPASMQARNLISLFGLTADELSESGLTYEALRSLDLVLA